MKLVLRVCSESAATKQQQQVFCDERSIVGRSKGCHLCFSDENLGPRVSGRHAEFHLRRDGLFVRDLNSTNGTYVNEEKVDECALHVGDRVGLGRKGPKLEVLAFELPDPVERRVSEVPGPSEGPFGYLKSEDPVEEHESPADAETPQEPVSDELFPEDVESPPLGTTRKMLVEEISHNRQQWSYARLLVGWCLVLVLVATVVAAIVLLPPVLAVWFNPPPARVDLTIYPQLLKSTVFVVDPVKGPLGSGSLVDQERRYVITSYHVVGQRDEVEIYAPVYSSGELIAERDQAILEASPIATKVIHRDPGRDLAVLQIDSLWDGAQALELADERVKPGQRVHSVGNPETSTALWVYAEGTVRAVYHDVFEVEDRLIDVDIIETPSLLNPGDSGGPLVNDDVELVGVAMATRHMIGGRVGSYFIDAREVRVVLTEVP